MSKSCSGLLRELVKCVIESDCFEVRFCPPLLSTDLPISGERRREAVSEGRDLSRISGSLLHLQTRSVGHANKDPRKQRILTRTILKLRSMEARLASLRGFPPRTGSGLIPVRPLGRWHLRSWTSRRPFCVLPKDTSSVSFDLEETDSTKSMAIESTDELEIELLQSSDSDDDEVVE